jgi:hypothetical protein
MDLVPENLGGAVVFNLNSSCGSSKTVCGNCGEFAVAIHNWLMNTEVRYVLLDLQDEKEICPAFLEEVMQLSKRMRIPFLFAGVMEKPRKILEAYDFMRRWPIFITPEEAVSYLEEKHPGTTKVSLDGLEFGIAIATSRARNGVTPEADGADAEAVE